LNPFRTRIVNTYLKGGDHVCFVRPHGCNVRQAITPDIPTVFRLNRRVLDVGVGYNNLSVLVGGLACPNEIYAIGENCHGELGIQSYVSQVCFKQVNRCLFDCQVVSIWSAKNVTMYITQSHKVYGSGKWKCTVNSNVPRWVQTICPSWKVKEVNISQTHIVLVSTDGLIWGFGDNSIGTLGLCHIQCVPEVTPLSFFNKLSVDCFADCRDQLLHPVRRGYVANKDYYHNDECKCEPCDSPKLCLPYPQQAYPQQAYPVQRPCAKKCLIEPIPAIRYFKKQGCGAKFLPNTRLCNTGRCSK
jgi:hypothetical protein